MIGKHTACGVAVPGESVGPDPSLKFFKQYQLNKSVLFMLDMKLGKVVYESQTGQS